jgi:Arc/MetJ family transcription regulator
VYNTHMATHAEGAVRTNIVLDEALVEEAMEITGARTKKEVVHLALEELIRSRKKKSLTDLAGRIRFRKDFDPKALRKLRG